MKIVTRKMEHFFATPEEARLIRDREKEIGILKVMKEILKRLSTIC
ncbi:MAG: hypothetical protein K6G01_05035 [Eubacterium sp.]|nr:hypothetical protein [Eubacterium sp.]